jgi:hypothetical protein
MPTAQIPLGVRRFIERRIKRVEQLEILLLLQRESERYWDAPTVAQSLQLAEWDVADDLEALGRRGLLDIRIAAAVMTVSVRRLPHVVCVPLFRLYRKRPLSVSARSIGALPSPVTAVRPSASSSSIVPSKLIACPKTILHRWVVAEIDRLVDVVPIGVDRRKRLRGVVRGAEPHHVLASEKHHFLCRMPLLTFRSMGMPASRNSAIRSAVSG